MNRWLGLGLVFSSISVVATHGLLNVTPRIISPSPSIVCRIEALVTTPQTVSFYVNSVRAANRLGTIAVGQHIIDKQHCIAANKKSRIIALTWSPSGKVHRYYSRQFASNINQLLWVQYPKDFGHQAIANSQNQVLCRSKILNSSSSAITLYSGKVSEQHWIGKVAPRKLLQQPTACYNNQRLIAVVDAHQKNAHHHRHEYRSKSRYNNFNHLQAINFPDDFAVTALA